MLQPVSVISDPLWRLAVNIVRTSIRDDPRLNRLITGEETNDRMIAWAIVDCLDNFNITPPLLNPPFELYHFLAADGRISGFSMIRVGTVARLLESIIHLKMRNYMSYSDGGVTVTTEEGVPQLMQLKGAMEQYYENIKREYKVAKNISRAMGPSNTHSPYWLINGGMLGQYRPQ